MNYCPDCGIKEPSDYHTCEEYEENQRREKDGRLTLAQEVEILKCEVKELQYKVKMMRGGL
jgi:hypothetical protein